MRKKLQLADGEKIEVIVKADAMAISDSTIEDDEGDLLFTVKRVDKNGQEYEAAITAMYTFLVKPLRKDQKAITAFALFSDKSINDNNAIACVQNILDQLNEGGFRANSISADGDPAFHYAYATDNLCHILNRYRSGRTCNKMKLILSPVTDSIQIKFIPDPVHLGKVLRKRLIKYLVSICGWDRLIANTDWGEYKQLFTNAAILDGSPSNSQDDEFPLQMFNFQTLEKISKLPESPCKRAMFIFTFIASVTQLMFIDFDCSKLQ